MYCELCNKDKSRISFEFIINEVKSICPKCLKNQTKMRVDYIGK